MMIPAVTYSLLMFVSGAAFGWWVNKKRKSGLELGGSAINENS